jgi:phage/plasmid primase-like uncharacterized protein
VSSVTKEALGRWNHILPALGIPADSLTSKHKPCPGCGGKDRFRYVGGDRGNWFCGGAGDTTGGDGFNLLMHVHGWEFKDVAREVEKVLGLKNEGTAPVQLFSKEQLETMLLFVLIYRDNKAAGFQLTTQDKEKFECYVAALKQSRAE